MISSIYAHIGMLRFIVTLILCAMTAQFIFADDNNQAERYVKEAEYYQKKAVNYRREAQYYLKKADGYERETTYYTKKGNTDRAKDYQRMASRAMADYKTQMRYAVNADNKAADYLRRASNLLRR